MTFAANFTSDTDYFDQALMEHNRHRERIGMVESRFEDLSGDEQHLVIARAQKLKEQAQKGRRTTDGV